MKYGQTVHQPICQLLPMIDKIFAYREWLFGLGFTSNVLVNTQISKALQTVSLFEMTASFYTMILSLATH